jgi:hypothetical protein
MKGARRRGRGGAQARVGGPVALRERLAALDWEAIGERLLERGFATTPRLLEGAECSALAALYDDDRRFRKTVDMERHRFGVGSYRYFRDPLPPRVATLRREAYARLAPVANEMEARLGRAPSWPAGLAELRARCAAAGQALPTPLLLRYGPGGYNCLHRELYGPIAFPLQMAVFLSRPGRDYGGGAFLLVEQLPRSQSVGEALLPRQGEAVVFATAERPRRGARGWQRAGVRHGVATVTRGRRTTLGIIFHDARS